MEQTRKLKCVPFTGAALAAMFETGHETHMRCVDGLPQDAKFLGVREDTTRIGVFLVFEHASWPELKPGEIIPSLFPSFISLGCQPHAPFDLQVHNRVTATSEI